MGTSARWLDVNGAAKVLGKTPAEVRKMAQNGDIQTQQNGNITEYRFSFDPKAIPQYTPVPTPKP